MGKNKLKKFADNLRFPNVFENFDVTSPELLGENAEPVDLVGRWSAAHFGNEHPLTLELACGRGEYSLALAERFPGRNFIGVDIKGARIWKGASRALEAGLQNVAFLRTRIEMIDRFFAPGEIAEIWVTFPDPFPRKSKANRRLTGPRFLDTYRRILAPGGLVHLKTDDPGLYEFTLETLAAEAKGELLYHNSDIYAAPLPFAELATRTYYEQMHLAEGKTIKYVRFTIH